MEGLFRRFGVSDKVQPRSVIIRLGIANISAGRTFDIAYSVVMQFF